LDDIDKMRWVGGFAMTEMGHGSNVRELETMATYDKETEEFIINTPTTTATKFWIGNMAGKQAS
jgi:acyl-CoA oxidase